ncbi:MAG: NADH-quinone oxidoreductase subunit J [Chloroflexota bacterium]|nr:NADH-quinone oxidoreductase subunit J [Chloroflexota bacterium]
MTEFWLFLIAGVIAVSAAALMLLSSNAVHSALFLVLTMAAIAFLFLLLNAPFLAMIQITVYAGAIMVLFLFVIMLLGSEQGESEDAFASRRPFRWFVPVALTLTLSLLLAIGLTISASSGSESSLQTVPPQNARLRVVHAAGDAGIVDVQLDGITILEEVAFRDDSGYMELAPGAYTVALVAADGTTLTQDVSLLASSVGTLVAYSDDAGLRLGFAAEDLDTVAEARSGRLVVFNAYPEAPVVSLVDLGSEFVENDTRVIAENIPYGASSLPLVIDEGDVDWQIVAGDATLDGIADNVNDDLAALSRFEVERNSAELVVVTRARTADGSPTGVLLPTTLLLQTMARPSFGGPEAIGYLLFTDYLLPFQLLALLLLAAMVGAIVLTHRQVTPSANRIGVRRRVSRPLVNVITAQVGHDVTDEEVNRLPDDQPQAVGD